MLRKKEKFMIYFDNAATGGFKVNAAVSAATSVIKFLTANPGRSGHRLSVTGAKIISDCRKILADAFDCDPSRVVFTANCTEALNFAIFGGIKSGKVLTTFFEHNSVLRPLFALRKKGAIDLKILSPEEIAESLKTETPSAIVMTAASNVTGKILPVKEIGAIAKERGIFFITDGAQGGGHIPLKVREYGISCLALAGHKGLGAIMGSGALLVNDGVDIDPILYGGTGTETFLDAMPEFYPERLEAGTPALPAIASLLEGVRHADGNISHFSKTLTHYTERLINGLKTVEKVTIYSEPNPVGIVSFKIADLPSEEAADILNSRFDVAVRGGFHCAPLIHKYLKTDGEGLVRASLAVQNSSYEIDFFIKAIKRIANGEFNV